MFTVTLQMQANTLVVCSTIALLSSIDSRNVEKSNDIVGCQSIPFHFHFNHNNQEVIYFILKSFV